MTDHCLMEYGHYDLGEDGEFPFDLTPDLARKMVDVAGRLPITGHDFSGPALGFFGVEARDDGVWAVGVELTAAGAGYSDLVLAAVMYPDEGRIVSAFPTTPDQRLKPTERSGA